MLTADDSWELAIDFGATTTCAATRRNGEVRLLRFDTGPHEAAVLSGRALAMGPRTRVDGATVQTSELVAAMLDRVAGQAADRHHGCAPARLVLSHPARWDAEVLGRLAEAAGRAGLPQPQWVSEPVAAARHYADASLAQGAYVAVFDLGGETFDATVLSLADDGFRLAGPPGGDENLGGADFDDVLFDLVAQAARGIDENAWLALGDGSGELRPRLCRQMRLAKETLSERLTCWVEADGFGTRIRVTRPEFEQAAAGLVERAVDGFTSTLELAGVAAADLAAVYLAGGGSRMPLVFDRLSVALGRLPLLCEDPKAAVVLGALAAPAGRPAGPPGQRGGAPAGPGGRPTGRPPPVVRFQPDSSPFSED